MAFAAMLKLWMQAAVAVELVGVVLEGLKNNLWGFRCPLYCSQPDIPLILLTYLLGALCGALACFVFIRYYHQLPVFPSPAAPAVPPNQTRSRLAVYGF